MRWITGRITAALAAGTLLLALLLAGCAPDEDADPVDRPDETLEIDEDQEPGEPHEEGDEDPPPLPPPDEEELEELDDD